MSQECKQIVCMNWGTPYGPNYVNRLYSMIARNITGPFRVVCLTDNIEGIRSEVECFPCPEIKLPFPYCNHGWRKIVTWAPEVVGLHPGQVLFLDLDLVITGSLDPFFTYEPEEDFVVIHNWTHPHRQIGNTSVYRFRVGSHPYLLSNIERDQLDCLARHNNEQTYISQTISRQKFWPKEWCCSFKAHCIPKGIMRFFTEPKLPEGVRIVAFTGVPNPPDAIVGHWPAPWYWRFYKRFKPAKWVAENWR